MATIPSVELRPAAASGLRRRSSEIVIWIAVVYWLFQFAWFWRYCGRNINVDAISYIGIARHVADGDFRASLHAYWSPLISWVIAAVSFPSADHTLPARLVMLPIFAVCLVLLYWFTQRLWGSRLLSALAVLWFAAARGIVALSVYFIGADLLLTAAVLTYFILLLRCLEQPREGWRWAALGAAHGAAFLAKAIAMPLLAVTSALTVLSVFGKSPRQSMRALIFAAVFPALVWVSWGTALRQKYGIFTAGSQLHRNLLDPAVRQARETSSGLITLRDARSDYDSYMVADSMPPGSGFWQTSVWRRTLPGQVARKEIENVPLAGKELLVLLTPGGVMALVLCIVQLWRHRRTYPVHFRTLSIVLLMTTTLVFAYGMLVFDQRYVLPVIPILIGFAIRFAMPPGETKKLFPRDLDYSGRWQPAAGVLLIIGLIAVQVYWASPFRTIGQDFQTSVYAAADALRKAEARKVIAIGEGPYPEHGVGWEAGLYAAYFAGSRIVADLFQVPRAVNADFIVTDVEKMGPDAVVIWGSPSNPQYPMVVDALRKSYGRAKAIPVRDPVRGEVGTVLILKAIS